MKVNRAYKLNKEKQPAEEKGEFLYGFYNKKTRLNENSSNEYLVVVSVVNQPNHF